jgi:tetratricopeptide (TPR) repeat protein
MALFCRVYDLKSQAINALVFFLLGMGLPERVVAIIEPAVKDNPRDAKLRGWLGWALRRAQKNNDAISHLKEGLELSPENGWLWGLLGVAYRHVDDFDNAEACLRKAIELDKETHLKWAHYDLGYVYQQKHKYSEAIACFKKAIELGWKSDLPHFQMAEINRENFNNPENAIIEYEIGIQLEQRPFGLPRPIFGLARALEAAGHTAEARQRYQEYLDRFPWGKHAQEALTALERLGAV